MPSSKPSASKTVHATSENACSSVAVQNSDTPTPASKRHDAANEQTHSAKSAGTTATAREANGAVGRGGCASSRCNAAGTRVSLGVAGDGTGEGTRRRDKGGKKRRGSRAGENTVNKKRGSRTVNAYVIQICVEPVLFHALPRLRSNVKEVAVVVVGARVTRAVASFALSSETVERSFVLRCRRRRRVFCLLCRRFFFFVLRLRLLVAVDANAFQLIVKVGIAVQVRKYQCAVVVVDDDAASGRWRCRRACRSARSCANKAHCTTTSDKNNGRASLSTRSAVRRCCGRRLPRLPRLRRCDTRRQSWSVGDRWVTASAASAFAAAAAAIIVPATRTEKWQWFGGLPLGRRRVDAEISRAPAVARG